LKSREVKRYRFPGFGFRIDGGTRRVPEVEISGVLAIGGLICCYSKSMTVVRDSDPAVFLQHAGPLLYAREAEYGLPLGLVEALQTYLKPEITPLLLRVTESDVTTAVCVQTRPENVMVSCLSDEQAAALAAYFHENQLPLAGAIGPAPGVKAFCAFHSAAPLHVRMSQRILQLTQVNPPQLAPGRLRIAEPADFETVSCFFHEFHAECLPHEIPTPASLSKLIEDRIARKTVYLWEDDGNVVSSAHTSRPTRNGISIGPVFTPPQQRGRGYASNLMAALSQRLLDGGKRFCVLFTDTLNPTSNKIYESIGYRVIGTSEFLTYTP
jgi:uncharacterized protein